MSKHIFNRSIQFGISRKALVAMAIVATFPAVAIAGPSVGLGYSNVGMTGHSGRPGVTVTAGNLYKNDVVASGSATVARGYYGMNANLGKMIPTGGTVSFEPYLSLGFLNLNYQQHKTGYTTTTSSSFGQSVTMTTPYSHIRPASITDFFGLAGVNLNVPIGQKVVLQIGGGYGHTLMTYGGNGAGGAVYKGEAKAAFEVAHNVTANVTVSYLHVSGASLTSEGAGLAYHFS